MRLAWGSGPFPWRVPVKVFSENRNRSSELEPSKTQIISIQSFFPPLYETDVMEKKVQSSLPIYMAFDQGLIGENINAFEGLHTYILLRK